MSDLVLPDIGEPGTAAAFQRERLREWGLGEFADACTSREQALIVHHCALYIRNVWRDLEGPDAEPPQAAVRHCVAEMVARPEILERTDHLLRSEAVHDDWEDNLKADPKLYDEVASALGEFRSR